ncbi:MAG: hypothetical protein PHV02_11830 [Rhodocyclaceae bacterium]|nr:hypothetical protein [Rhodocyclaceae bacterium]
MRHLLLVAVLVFAQWAAVGHSVEHAMGDQDAPQHACALCLVAHDLTAALPSVALIPLPLAPYLAPEMLPLHSRSSFPAPLAVQRGPPQA